MSKRPRAKCCQKYLRKSKACKRCPLMVALSKKQRQKAIRRLVKKAA